MAKTKHGRDSLAVRVWKGSGLHLTWARPWPKALIGDSDTLHIAAIAARLEEEQSRLFSSGFFFRANAIYEAMKEIGDEKTIKDLILYEYGHSLASNGRAATKKEIETIVNPLYEQSLPCRRVLDAQGGCHYEEFDGAQADAAMLVRFLVQKGVNGTRDAAPTTATAINHEGAPDEHA